ncbi:MAG: hypothetical protein WCD18_23625, partial [Thermosynechococcaceae cyanobacterium]
MEITILGYILLPLGLWAFLQKSWKFLFQVFIFFVPFSASAVINLPTFGIQPAIYLGFLIISRIILGLTLKAINNKKIAKISNKQILVLSLFWIFIVAALLSILTIPFVGTVIVSRPSGDNGILRIGVENFTQLIYLVYFITFVTIISLCKLEEIDLKEVLFVFTISSIFVCIWGWIQITMYKVGIQYPDFLFNNNNSGAQSYGQVIKSVSIKRMNSVLQEPSRMARFMVVPTFIYLYQIIYKPDLIFKQKYISLILSIIFSFTLFATTSSTAYVSFGFGVLFLIFLMIWKNIYAININPKEIRRAFVVSLGYIIGFLSVLLLVMQILDLGIQDIVELLDVVLFNKIDSNSAEGR